MKTFTVTAPPGFLGTEGTVTFQRTPVASVCAWEGRDALGRRTCCDQDAGHDGPHDALLSEDF